MEQDNTLFNAAITKGWATVLHIAGGTNHVHFVEELVRRLERDDLELQDEKGNTAFCFAAAVGNVEIAKIMLRKNESLPRIRGGEGLTPLHMALLQGRSAMAWYLLPKSKEILEESDWEIFLTKLDDSTLMNSIRQPSQVTFIAAEAGNFEFLSVVISTYPDLIWELDTIGRTIIHSAVLHRHASIFNLIHEIGPMKDLILTFVDDEGNNLLHCAARLAPPNRLNIVSGAALQMMLELSWFEEVKKIMIPLFIEMENSERFTPRQIFTKEHEELLKNGESWMKRTANSCMVVSTLIATGVFSAAFSVPGGNNDNTRSPNYMEKPAFLVFVLSDAIAFISSSTSIIIFLSILMSRYAEEDFLKTLPLMLISGLVALFISIISMMVGFSSAFFITYYHGLKWVPNFIAALAFVPIPLFIFLQFPLWSDIVYSTYICSSLFRPSKPMIH